MGDILVDDRALVFVMGRRALLAQGRGIGAVDALADEHLLVRIGFAVQLGQTLAADEPHDPWRLQHAGLRKPVAGGKRFRRCAVGHIDDRHGAERGRAVFRQQRSGKAKLFAVRGHMRQMGLHGLGALFGRPGRIEAADIELRRAREVVIQQRLTRQPVTRIVGPVAAGIVRTCGQRLFGRRAGGVKEGPGMGAAPFQAGDELCLEIVGHGAGDPNIGQQGVRPGPDQRIVVDQVVFQNPVREQMTLQERGIGRIDQRQVRPVEIGAVIAAPCEHPSTLASLSFASATACSISSLDLE